MGSHRYFVAALVTLLAGAGSAAFGTTTVVLPGPGTPLQDAIDAAAPGDTLRIQDAFEENIVIDKPLRIMPSRRGILQGAAISATCGSAASTIDVQADRVTIRDITVSGGTHAAINVVGRNDVRISGVELVPDISTIPGVTSPCPVDYGIYVSQSTDVKLKGNRHSGGGDQGSYGEAFIFVGDVPSDGKVQILGNGTNDPHGHGILLEDVAAPSRRPKVKVVRNTINSSLVGILLRNSDGLLLKRNIVSLCSGAGIELDSQSDGNLIRVNQSTFNIPDVVDAGSSNCWKRNTFDTGSVPPCP